MNEPATQPEPELKFSPDLKDLQDYHETGVRRDFSPATLQTLNDKAPGAYELGKAIHDNFGLEPSTGKVVGLVSAIYDDKKMQDATSSTDRYNRLSEIISERKLNIPARNRMAILDAVPQRRSK